MEAGLNQIQNMVNLTLVMGASMVALICARLKGVSRREFPAAAVVETHMPEPRRVLSRASAPAAFHQVARAAGGIAPLQRRIDSPRNITGLVICIGVSSSTHAATAAGLPAAVRSALVALLDLATDLFPPIVRE